MRHSLSSARTEEATRIVAEKRAIGGGVTAAPGDSRSCQRSCVEVRAWFERRRGALLLATIVAGASLAAIPGQAQERPGWIRERIEDVFSLIPRNEMALAVSLTRRALVRRSQEVEALPFRGVDASSEGAPLSANAAPFATVDAATGLALDMEEGSADPAEGSELVARLPRPRPLPDAAPPAEIETAPLDLIAGEPMDLVYAGLPAEPLVAAAEPAATDDEASASAAPELAAATFSAPAEQADAVEAVAAAAASAPAATARREGCIALSDATDGDGDFRRNSAALADPAFCVAEAKFDERRHKWIVHTIDSGRPGPLWPVMHDDEDTAFDNAVYGLARYGGVLVAVETGGKRNQDGVDPNRNFSADGVGCSKIGKDAAPLFTALFRPRYLAGQPIIALHANQGARISTGGLGHVSMDAAPRSMRVVPSADKGSELADTHTLVLLAATDPTAAPIEERADALSGSGVNVVIEPVRKGRGDCSLSNDAVLSGHDAYYNVTVDGEDGDKQRRIIDMIMSGLSTVAASR